MVLSELGNTILWDDASFIEISFRTSFIIMPFTLACMGTKIMSSIEEVKSRKLFNSKIWPVPSSWSTAIIPFISFTSLIGSYPPWNGETLYDLPSILSNTLTCFPAHEVSAWVLMPTLHPALFSSDVDVAKILFLIYALYWFIPKIFTSGILLVLSPETWTFMTVISLSEYTIQQYTSKWLMKSIIICNIFATYKDSQLWVVLLFLDCAATDWLSLSLVGSKWVLLLFSTSLIVSVIVDLMLLVSILLSILWLEDRIPFLAFKSSSFCV